MFQERPHYLENYNNPCWYENNGSSRPKLVCIPKIIVAGVAKCGTTEFNHLLASHPMILPASDEEELYFWSRQWKKNSWVYVTYPMSDLSSISMSYWYNREGKPPSRLCRHWYTNDHLYTVEGSLFIHHLCIRHVFFGFCKNVRLPVFYADIFWDPWSQSYIPVLDGMMEWCMRSR